MTTAATAQQRDRLVRNVNDYAPTRGMTALDCAMRAGGPHISRSFLIPRLTESQEMRRYTGPGNGELLCRGAAVGRCSDGRSRHIRPYNAPQQFLGFLEKTIDLDMVLVVCRGNVELHVGPDAQPGDPVFCDNVDSFSVKATPGACKIGIVFSLVPDRPGNAVVLFKSFDDPRLLEPLGKKQ
jgi:hypothetical protein